MNSYAYNAAGWMSVATDPKGIGDRTEYDLLGRTTKTIEAYADGTPSDADDRITAYTYDGMDQIRTLKADLPSGQNDQTTEYVYGVTPTTSSDVYSNDLLAETRYPDKSTGLAGTTNSDKDRYAYSALGQVTKMTDRNQSTHEYAYDAMGRTLSDAVTVLASGVDGAVRRLETAYDTAGRAFKFTSYNAATAGTVVNQVQRAFNGLGQVTREYENHDGTVNTSTTPWVGYGYDATAASGVLAKGSRPTTLTYPNGRVVNNNYFAGLDDTISRLSSLTDGATTLESYSYLGLGTVVVRAHPQPGVDLTYVAASGTGDAGDKYTGLDRFGRIADQRWKKGTTDLDRFVHTYDRNSNRLTRDVTATGAPTNRDEAYTYDNLDRLTKTNRGSLSSGTITDAAAAYRRNWNLDPLGNWGSLTTDADGGGGGSATSEARTHNGQNQVSAVGASSLTYDSNGSLTNDATTGKTYTYDAWNALVKVQSGGATIASHEYDALRRQAQSGTTTPSDERWFSLNWQVLETRPADGKTTQQVWSPVYVDAMVARDRDTDANGSLDERVYPLHDANFDVTATVNTSGTVIDRFIYDRYGTFTVLDPNWVADADGVSDVAWGNFYQGLPFDAAAGGSVARWRIVLHYLGRPLQTDPIGYPDGLSRYQWEGSSPAGTLDPFGLQQQPATQPATKPPTKPSSPPSLIKLPGGRGTKPASGSASFAIPNIGTINLYGGNTNLWKSGGGEFGAKVSRAKGCPCKTLQWTQEVRITINNEAAFTPDQLAPAWAGETDEHGGNDPFNGFVPDNGYDPFPVPHDPDDPWSPGPMYKTPRPAIKPISRPKDWSDPGGSVMAPGDQAFADGPWLPVGLGTNYPRGADVTKEFIVRLLCDGKQIGPTIRWSVRGIAGSAAPSTLEVHLEE